MLSANSCPASLSGSRGQAGSDRHLSTSSSGKSDSNAGARATDRLEADPARVDGEVRFDAGTRGTYSADGSNFRQVPIGVVVRMTIDKAAGYAA